MGENKKCQSKECIGKYSYRNTSKNRLRRFELNHVGRLAIFLHSCEKMKTRIVYWEKDRFRENAIEFLIRFGNHRQGDSEDSDSVFQRFAFHY